MSTRTITLPDELVDRLETLAQTLGRPLDEVVSDLLEHYSPTPAHWALALAEAMEEADIDSASRVIPFSSQPGARRAASVLRTTRIEVLLDAQS
jgi:predicted DNA-binding protein